MLRALKCIPDHRVMIFGMWQNSLLQLSFTVTAPLKLQWAKVHRNDVSYSFGRFRPWLSRGQTDGLVPGAKPQTGQEAASLAKRSETLRHSAAALKGRPNSWSSGGKLMSSGLRLVNVEACLTIPCHQYIRTCSSFLHFC